MRIRTLRLLLIPILLSACSALSIPTPTDSGVSGQALMGPMCPVMFEGQDCPDRPFQATLTVLDRSGKQLVQFQTDEDGAFRVPLAPGEYILQPETPEGMPYPFGDRQDFSVLPGQFTSIIVSYDSGIR
jgi:hypothetical protein